MIINSSKISRKPRQGSQESGQETLSLPAMADYSLLPGNTLEAASTEPEGKMFCHEVGIYPEICLSRGRAATSGVKSRGASSEQLLPK